MQELDYWLILNKIGLLPRIQLALLEYFGSPEAIIEAGEGELRRVKGVGTEVAARIIKARSEIDLSSDKRVLERLNVELISIFDERYPRLLRDIYDPPPLLYLRGSLERVDEVAVSIVGSRSASLRGQEVARKLAGELAAQGVTIVSGLAVGVDSAAHRGALDGKGRTFGVMACGTDVEYPSQNAELRKEIVDSGALISEMPIGSRPRRHVFQGRNRLISGLSLGTVVVEAPEKSGALITADHALEQGRHVFAVPGDVSLPTHRGTHALLREGATLVESAMDILEPLGIEAPKLPKVAAISEREQMPEAELSSSEQKIFSVLTGKQKYIDQIIEDTQLRPAEVSAALMLLELKGLARRLPGGSFVRA